jgi:catalase
MQMQVPKGRVNYEPSSLQADSPRASQALGFRHFAQADDGVKGRVRAESFADHYSQARMFYRSQSPLEQAHLASATVFELSKVGTPHVREAVVGHLQHVDPELAQRVADGLGMQTLPPAPPAAEPVQDLPLSPALRIIDRMKPTLQGRAIGILVADGSNGTSVANLRKALEKAGATVKIVAPKVGGAVLKDGTLLPADGQLAGTPSVVFDAVASVLSPDMGAVLAKEAAAVDWFRDAFGHLKAIAACKGTQAILQAGGIEPDAGVLDPADVQGFIAAAQTRQWDREPKLRTLA